MQRQPKIAFIGGGNATTALVAGLCKAGWNPDKLMVAEPDGNRRGVLRQSYRIHTTSDNHAAATFAEVVVLAIKPQIARSVIAHLAPVLTEHDAVVASLVAGLTSAQIEAWIGADLAIVRLMPNTPAMLGVSASGLYANPRVNAAQRAQVTSIAEAIGIGIWVAEEALMDVVTAVAGSGPAYFYLTIEALQEAAQAQGLPPTAAAQLVAQTALGAARMVCESNEDPATLRQRVTSSGGTTECALKTLHAGGLRELYARAVASAMARARELTMPAEASE